jgi:hypothetical protein
MANMNMIPPKPERKAQLEEYAMAGVGRSSSKPR